MILPTIGLVLIAIAATQGGGGISPTFGAALWILDYVVQTIILGTNALYFHQGTIGNCEFGLARLLGIV